MLRNKVEIVGKSAFSNPKINELDQPETDLQGDDVGGATGYGALTEEKKWSLLQIHKTNYISTYFFQIA